MSLNVIGHAVCSTIIGIILSGGQKQRVALARAIVRDSAILVLDDALSSVDSHTAAEILAGLRSVMRGRTSIIIAHRLSTIRHVERIIVMHKGRSVEDGSHEQLLAQRGYYYRLHSGLLQQIVVS